MMSSASARAERGQDLAHLLATKLNRLITFSGEPVNFSRRLSSCVHDPDRQVFMWHCRHA